MVLVRSLISVHCLLALSEVQSFQPSNPFLATIAPLSRDARSGARIESYHFSQPGDDDKLSDAPIPGDNNEESSEKSGRLPGWVSRWTRGRSDDAAESSTSENEPLATTNTPTSATITKVDRSSRNKESLSPVEQAQLLKAQAEKARLEAERMDAELTLQKIERLERELVQAKAKGADSVEDLQRQMAALQAKLTGESVKPVVAPVRKPIESSTVEISTDPLKDILSAKKAIPPPKGDFFSSLPDAVELFDQAKYDEVLVDFENSPDFLKKLITTQIGIDYPEDGNVNSTTVATRLDKIRRFDFSFDNEGERPSFTQEKIEEMKQRMQATWLTDETAFLPEGRLTDFADGNETKLALMCLEYEYYNSKYKITEASFFEDEEVIAEISSAIQQLSFDSVTESSLPPCTRKEDQQPTLAQAQTLVKDVLPKASFTSTSKPMAVPGGFIVKGNSKASDGDALITAIDQQLERSSLRGKMTVCYMADFTAFLEENSDQIDLDNIGTVLFIGGPDIAREPKKGLLSITSAFGLATCWYLSLYPFLLNPNLAKRVDEQLALVDAGMPADLSWLSDLSFPLFVTFIAIQILHELGHRVAAALNDIQPTFPTFVPSIITGVTSVTTSFKEPPKNLQALFDFSIAGPLLGMLASIVAIVVGTQLSIGVDPTNFPALPLEILRQSSLGGGIIDSILGSGVLSVPDAALGTQAVAGMTIPLHPVAIAGYISLVVNALSMLPIGSKYYYMVLLP